MIIARQGTARTFTVGPVLDANGVAVNDRVITHFKISKNGAAYAALDAVTPAVLASIGAGKYRLTATAIDLAAAGMAEVDLQDGVATNNCPIKEICVRPSAIYDMFDADGALPITEADILQLVDDALVARHLHREVYGSGSVTGGAGGQLSFIDTSRTEPSGSIAGLWLQFTTGPNAGFTRLIATYTSTTKTITFELNFPFNISVGEQYILVRQAGVNTVQVQGTALRTPANGYLDVNVGRWLGTTAPIILDGAGLRLEIGMATPSFDQRTFDPVSRSILERVYKTTKSVDTSTFPATVTEFETTDTVNQPGRYTEQALTFLEGVNENITVRILTAVYTGNNKMKLTTDPLLAVPSNGDDFWVGGRIEH